MSQPKRRRQQRREKRKRIPTAQEIFDRIERADTAVKKLFLDEPLTDEELDALLHSEYMGTPEDRTGVAGGHHADTLYQQSKFGLAVTSPILFTNIELEVLAYFGRHPELMYSLPPRKFEELVATIFRNNGFDVQLTPETRDGGIDIIAVRQDVIGGSTLHLVECKRYLPENKVGIGVVQRMLGVVEQHRATQGLIVTTSSFSREAKTCAENSRYRLGLNEYADLSKWLASFAAGQDAVNDVVFVMEKSHRNKVSKKYRELLSGKRLVCLDIPDEYDCMEPALIDLLEARVRQHVRIPAPKRD